MNSLFYCNSKLLLLIWCGSIFVIDAITCAPFTFQLDKKAVIMPLNHSHITSAASLLDSNNTLVPSKLTLLITAPIAAGIFIIVLLFFCMILLEKPANSTDNYERLTNPTVVNDNDNVNEIFGNAQPQPSTSTSTTTAPQPVVVQITDNSQMSSETITTKAEVNNPL